MVSIILTIQAKEQSTVDICDSKNFDYFNSKSFIFIYFNIIKSC